MPLYYNIILFYHNTTQSAIHINQMSVTSLGATQIMQVTSTQITWSWLHQRVLTGALYGDGKDIGDIFIGQQVRLIKQDTKLITG